MLALLVVRVRVIVVHICNYFGRKFRFNLNHKFLKPKPNHNLEYTDHSMQDGDQYAPHLKYGHIANQLVCERHEVDSTEDPCGLVVFDGLTVLQAESH